MALPQDGVNMNELPKTSTIPTGKELLFIDPTTNEGGVITLEDLTKQILQNLTSQTFALDQGTKTLPAALNELNSNRLTCRRMGANKEVILPLHLYSAAIILGTVNAHVEGFYLVSRGTTNVAITPLTSKLSSDDFTITIINDETVSLKTKPSTDLKIIY